MTDYRYSYPDFPPHHPLADAIHQIFEAYMIARRHVTRRRGSFTQQDAHLIQRVRDTMWEHYFRLAELSEEVRLGYLEQASTFGEVVKNNRCQPDSKRLPKAD